MRSPIIIIASCGVVALALATGVLRPGLTPGTLDPGSPSREPSSASQIAASRAVKFSPASALKKQINS
jgi:hypothetical protein